MKGFLDYIIDSFVTIVTVLVVDIFELLKDIGFWVVEKVLQVGIWAMSLVTGSFTSIDISSQWGRVPITTLHFMDYLNMAECVGMIVSALIVRFVLNFVPFVR